MLQLPTPNVQEKGGETIEELFKQLPSYGKPECATYLQKDETIDEAISRITKSEGMYTMLCLMLQKTQNASQKGRATVNKALQLIDEELNLEKGLIAHRIRQKIASQQTQDKERDEPTGIDARLLDEDGTTMKDGVPKPTKAEQIQIMQGKSDELQRELRKDIQGYKLSRREDLPKVPDLDIPKHNKDAKRQVKEVQHTPKECRAQPVLDGHHWMAPNGVRRNNF